MGQLISTMKSVGGAETVLLHKLISLTTHDSAGVAVGVDVGLGCAQYFPPVFKKNGPRSLSPPHTSISLPLQTAV
jgi:hypothetical protein